MKASTDKEFTLEGELLRECEAMAKYAFASGMKVPGTLVQTLDDLANLVLSRSGKTPQANLDSPGSEKQEAADTPAPQNQPRDSVKELAAIHGRLSEIVAPATPRTLLLLATESAKGGFWKFLGPVPLVRGLMLVAILSLIALVCTSLSPQVDGSMDWAKEWGWSLLLEELFVISAAAIGASFFALF